MSTENIVNNEESKGLNPEIVIRFIKCNIVKIFIYAAITLIVCFLIGIFIYFIAPSRNYFSQRIELTLPIEGNVFRYPNGKAFNYTDITSPAVLKKVYKNNNLDNILPYSEFAELIGIGAYSTKRALLDADFSSKLSKRNLSATDIKNIEIEYNDSLQRLRHNTYDVMMLQGKIPAKTAVKVLNEIPQAWFEVFRVQESQNLPMTSIDEALVKQLKTKLDISYLIAIDQFGSYLYQLQRLNEYLGKLVNNRRISLPTGEYYEDINTMLHNLRIYNLGLLTQTILNSKELRGELDITYLQSRIYNLELTVNKLKMEQTNLFKSFEMVQVKGGSINVQAGKEPTEATAINFDSSIFGQLAELYNRDATNAIRREIAEQNITLGQELAQQESSLVKYQNMLKAIQSSATTQGSREKFVVMFNQMLDEAQVLSSKINMLKQMLIGEYYLSTTFYSNIGDSCMIKDHLVSPKKLGVVLLAVWVLLNALYVAILVSKDYSKAINRKN